MRLLRRMKTKYGISHPLCLLSLTACICFCAFIIIYTLDNYNETSSVSMARFTGGITLQEFMLFAEEIFDTVIESYSQVIAIGIEPILAVILQGGAGLINSVLGMPLDIQSTMFSMPYILLIAMIIYSIGKFMQCFECTRSFTMLTYGEFERLFGYITMIVISCQNVVKVIYVCEKHKNVLCNMFPGNNSEVFIGLFAFLIGAGSAFVGILVFYMIKTLVLGLQIMQLSISLFPFTSLVFEMLRSSLVVMSSIFNLLLPRVGFAFNTVAFILGVLFLAQTSSSVEYFRVIYLESLLIPFYRFRGDYIQLYKDVPLEIRKWCKDKQGIIVPVFSVGKFKVGGKEIANHEKWWMEVAEEKLNFYRRRFMSQRVEKIQIPLDVKKWYFKENMRCLELFDLNGPEENIIRLFKKPKQECCFVVSKEYEAIYKDIVNEMKAVDYNAVKAQLTKERKEYIEKENKAYYALTQ